MTAEPPDLDTEGLRLGIPDVGARTGSRPSADPEVLTVAARLWDGLAGSRGIAKAERLACDGRESGSPSGT